MDINKLHIEHICKTKNLIYANSSEWNEMANSLADAMQAAKEAQARADYYKARLIEISQEKNTCGDHYYFTKIERSGSLDLASIPVVQAVIKEIDVELYRKKSSTYWKLETV